jgi:hypothetical protein
VVFEDTFVELVEQIWHKRLKDIAPWEAIPERLCNCPDTNFFEYFGIMRAMLSQVVDVSTLVTE